MPVTPLPNRTFLFPRIRLSTSACPFVSYLVTYLHAGGDGIGYRALSSYASGRSVLFPRLLAGKVLHFSDVVYFEIAPVFATVLACVGCQTIDQLRACGS